MASKYNLRSQPPPDPVQKFDMQEYRELLNELFPSKYMSNRVKKIDAVKVKDPVEPAEKPAEAPAEKPADLAEESDENDSDYVTEDEEEDEDEEEEEEEDDDDDDEDDDEEYDTSDSDYDCVLHFKKKSSEKEPSAAAGNFKRLLKCKQANEEKYFDELDEPRQALLLSNLQQISDYNAQTKPYRIAILEADMSLELKALALKKISEINKNKDAEEGKLSCWVDGFMTLPFGKYIDLPVSFAADGPEKCNEFMTNAKKLLDASTYGMRDAKEKFMLHLGQLISNPKSTGTAILIQGPMGTGKTTLVKEGISQILQRPFSFVALGGATDSSYLEGHLFAYTGSEPGQIAKILSKSRCMNPVIFFDELDKVSEDAKGREIYNILMHLIDPAQNDNFADKYYGVNLDLSKAIFIFSCNDASKIDPILRDRMCVINTEGYTLPEKLVIARQYLDKTIRANVNFEAGQVLFPEETLAHLIENYTGDEKGVRNLKRCLETIYTKLNLFRLMHAENVDIRLKDVSFPYTVTVSVLQILLKRPPAENYLSMYT